MTCFSCGLQVKVKGIKKAKVVVKQYVETIEEFKGIAYPLM